MRVTSRMFFMSGLLAASTLLLGCPPPPTAQDDIVIGMINPATGALAAYGPAFENGVNLAFKQVNEAGGVLGRKVVLQIEDSKTDADASAAAADKLIAAGVPVIIGAGGSGNSIAVSQKTIAGKVVQITGASTSPELSDLADDGYVFRTVPSDAFQGVVLAREIYTADSLSSAAVLAVDNSYGNGLAAVFKAEFESLGGTVTTVRTYAENPSSGYNFQADLDVVYAGSPDAIVLIAYAEDGTSFLSTWNTNGGFTGSWYLGDGMKSDDIAAGVGAGVVEGIKGSAPASASGPAFDTFKSAYQAEFGEEAGIYAEYYYDAAMVVLLAMAKAGKAEGTAIRDQMNAVASPDGSTVGVGEAQKGLDAIAAGDEINYEGASGPVDFDARGDVSGPVEIWKFMGGTTTQVKIVDP